MSNFLGASKIMAAAAMAMAGLSSASTTAASSVKAFSGVISRHNRRVRGRGWNSKNDDARAAGIPKAFRQYAKRYGSNTHTLVATHLQINVPMIDHGRDRRDAFLRTFGAHK